jgi:membrane protein implicated in regulation of membrane protease activity
MKTFVWPRRFAVVFGVAFVVIGGAQLLRGRTAEYAALHALVWSAISATIFVAAQARRERRRERCGICDAIDGSGSESSRSGQIE